MEIVIASIDGSILVVVSVVVAEKVGHGAVAEEALTVTSGTIRVLRAGCAEKVSVVAFGA